MDYNNIMQLAIIVSIGLRSSNCGPTLATVRIIWNSLMETTAPSMRCICSSIWNWLYLQSVRFFPLATWSACLLGDFWLQFCFRLTQALSPPRLLVKLMVGFAYHSLKTQWSWRWWTDTFPHHQRYYLHSIE